VRGGAEKLLTDAGPALIAEVLRRFGRARVRVDGNSMLPAIRPGDVLFIAPRAIAQIKPADIVLFRVGSRLFAHRVVRIGTGYSGAPFLVTKGDTHHREDLPIVSSQLLGRVLGVSRNGRGRAEPLPYSRIASAAWMAASNGLRLASRIASLRRVIGLSRRCWI
jgi:signal peptidase I